MAITYNLLEDLPSTANTTAYSGAVTVTPVAGRHYLVLLRATRGSTLAAQSITVTQAGATPLTFTAITGFDVTSQEGATSSGARIVGFIASCDGSQTAGVVTATWGVSLTSNHLVILEVIGLDATTPIPQATGTQENNTTDGTLSISLAGGFADAQSGVLSAFSVSNGNTDPVIPPNWTSLLSTPNTAPVGRFVVAYRNANDGTAAWTGANTGGTEDLAVAIAEMHAAATLDVATITPRVTYLPTLFGI